MSIAVIDSCRTVLADAAKPVFRGPRGPVPYVARWSAEDVHEVPLVETRQGIAYADESSVDRDADGVLWTRMWSRPGVGEPFYREMHPLRQRRAMRLKKSHVTVRAKSFVSGAWGGLHRTGWPQRQPVLVDACTVQFGDPRLHWLQADHLVRELVDCILVDLDD